MNYKKMMAAMLGIGVIAGTSGSLYAQEKATATTEKPVQVVSDGGVDAAREAAEAKPVVGKKSISPEEVLKDFVRSKGWRVGWDPVKKRFIAIVSADFDCKDPTVTKFQQRRRFAAKEAILNGKVQVIQFLMNEISAEDAILAPGTSENKAHAQEVAEIETALVKQKEVVAELLREKDAAKAAELEGTTIGERFDDLMAAAIKKLDKDYQKDVHDQKKAARYQAAIASYKAEKEKLDELIKREKLKNRKADRTQLSKVGMMSIVPVFGATSLSYAESWDGASKYTVATAIVWSPVLERAARAIVVPEERVKIKPKAKGISLEEWLDKQDLSCMNGPYQFVDKDGHRWFLGVAAESMSPNLKSRIRNQNKKYAKLYAAQEALFSIGADAQAKEAAESTMKTYYNDDPSKEDDEVMDRMLEESIKFNAKLHISGGQIVRDATVTHPQSGEQIYVCVYAFEQDSAADGMKAYKSLYATKEQVERAQTVTRGEIAGAEARAKAAKNRPEDFQKGFNKSQRDIDRIIKNREAAQQKQGGFKAPAAGSNSNVGQQQKPQAVTTMGVTDVDDDF